MELCNLPYTSFHLFFLRYKTLSVPRLGTVAQLTATHLPKFLNSPFLSFKLGLQMHLHPAKFLIETGFHYVPQAVARTPD